MHDQMMFIPVVFCNKCRKNVDLVTRSAKSGKRPTLTAHCHGSQEDVAFVSEANKQVDAFV